MISFRNRSDLGPSIAILAACVAMLIATIYSFLPDPKAVSKQRAQHELEERVRKLDKDNEAAKAKIASQVWTLPTESVGPKALESITSYAQKQKVKILAFRPQKAVEVNGLNQLPFLISLEGSFPAVLGFVKNLETPDLKMAINSIQISTSDANSDTVSASIGLAAYKKLESPKQEKPNATKKEN